MGTHIAQRPLSPSPHRMEAGSSLPSACGIARVSGHRAMDCAGATAWPLSSRADSVLSETHEAFPNLSSFFCLPHPVSSPDLDSLLLAPHTFPLPSQASGAFSVDRPVRSQQPERGNQPLSNRIFARTLTCFPEGSEHGHGYMTMAGSDCARLSPRSASSQAALLKTTGLCLGFLTQLFPQVPEKEPPKTGTVGQQ